MSPALRACIASLSADAHGAVALVSGRTIADVDAMFAGATMAVAGQHGAERRRATGSVVRAALPAQRTQWARARLVEMARSHPGLTVEDKGSSLALHYRRAPALAAFAHRLVRALAAEGSPAFSVQPGKRVVELVPAGHDKGRAVLAFLGEAPFCGKRPVFVGDDLSDEAAFAVVNGMGGHSVKVGPGSTAARWRLDGVDDVGDWIRDLTPPPAAPTRRTRAKGPRSGR